MTTAEVIIGRLPNKPILSISEVAAAAGLKTPASIFCAIQEGKIKSVKIGGCYRIAREVAISYINQAAEEAAK